MGLVSFTAYIVKEQFHTQSQYGKTWLTFEKGMIRNAMVITMILVPIVKKYVSQRGLEAILMVSKENNKL